MFKTGHNLLIFLQQDTRTLYIRMKYYERLEFIIKNRGRKLGTKNIIHYQAITFVWAIGQIPTYLTMWSETYQRLILGTKKDRMVN